MLADGQRALSASWDRTLKLWDLEGNVVLRTLEGHEDTIHGVAALADGRRALSASEDWTLKLWDLESGAVLRTLEGHESASLRWRRCRTGRGRCPPRATTH